MADNSSKEKKGGMPCEIHLHNAPNCGCNINIYYAGQLVQGDCYEMHYAAPAPAAEQAARTAPVPAEAVPATAPAPASAPGRRKALFAKDGAPYVEDLDVRRREGRRLKDFLKAHHLSERRLTTQIDDVLNAYIAEFVHRWQACRLVAERVPSAALFRFLTEEVGLATDVGLSTFTGKIYKTVISVEVDVRLRQAVAEAFRA